MTQYKDEGKVTFCSSLGGVLGTAVINKADLDLFRIIAKLSKHTIIFIESEGYKELNDDHTQIKPCWKRKIKNKKESGLNGERIKD